MRPAIRELVSIIKVGLYGSGMGGWGPLLRVPEIFPWYYSLPAGDSDPILQLFTVTFCPDFPMWRKIRLVCGPFVFCVIWHMTFFSDQMESSKTNDPWKFTLKFLILQYWVPYSHSWICGCKIPWQYVYYNWGWNICIYNSGFTPLNVWIHGEHLSNWRLLPDSSRRTNRMDESMVHTKLRYKETENGVCFLQNCSTPLDFWTIHQKWWAMLGEFPKKEAWMELRGISAFSTWEIHVDLAKICPPTKSAVTNDIDHWCLNVLNLILL